MSSQRKPAGQGRPGGPPPERKAPAGPVFTPQVLGVLYAIALIILVAVFWVKVVNTNVAQQQADDARKQQADANIATYKKKGSKLEIAKQVNTTVATKLKNTSYMFLTDQTSVLPFWEDVFFPLLRASNLTWSDQTKIKVDPYTFKLNMAMSPFNTLPHSGLFDDAVKIFPIHYDPEQGGVPIEEPIDTMEPAFLTPYTITLEKFNGTYEQVKRFVKELQVKQNKTLFTVHCFKNDEQSDFFGYRTTSDWTIVLTVYFINPEATASGDSPPGLPGASSC